MKTCTACGGNDVRNKKFDLCYSCWQAIEERDNSVPPEAHFEECLTHDKTYTVYVLFYGVDKVKIGYSKDISSRLIEIRRTYKDNQFVYFREFTNESLARRFEAWMKGLSGRSLMRFISRWQDKIKKVDLF